MVKAEYGCSVYCDATNYGPVQGGGEEAGGTGGDAVVETYGTLPGRVNVDGGDGGGGGRVWAGEIKGGVKTEDPRIWDNGKGYKVVN